jgi:hypothetical protein
MAVLAGLFATFSGPALAQEKRVALVIGNDAHKGLPKFFFDTGPALHGREEQ